MLQNGDRLRIAVIGSPRSGNTWNRWILKSLYGLEERSAHAPDEVGWESLPERCVLQIHWYPLDPFLALLDQHQVQVVLAIRHPLDVLMSWINYMYYVHEEGKCGGNCGSCQVAGALPMSDTFLEWVLGQEGRNLLCYGPAWINRPGVIPIRYESLINRPIETLEQLTSRIGRPTQARIEDVIEQTSFRQKKTGRGFWQYHFWQGQPDLWRRMLTADAARAIAAWIPEAFEWLDYACNPDESLDRHSADRNWLQLQLDSVREHLSLEKTKHRHTAEALESLSRAG